MEFQLEPFHRNISDDELLKDLKRVAKELGKEMVTKAEYDKKGKFSSDTYLRRFGSWFIAVEKAGLKRTRNFNIPDEELIEDLVRVAKGLVKERVTTDEYNEKGKFSSSTFISRFGSWFVALKMAGLKRTRNLNISDEELFNNLIEVWTVLGHQPKYNDLTKDVSKYSSGTYEKRFGGWRKALEAFVKWANEGICPECIEQESVGINEGINTEFIDQGSSGIKRRTSRHINWKLRALVLMRNGARCQLCGATPQQHGVRLHVDHIKAWNNGGETILENLQILCEQCNIGKSDIEI
jgi:hypothetical protein